MTKNLILQEKIKNKIYTIRNQQVMLDKDLAELYEVETKVFNQSIRRNLDLFPKDFMFQLTKSEFDNLRSQFVTSKSWGGRRYLPFVFTEQGVATLSGVLKSQRAKRLNIKIMRAFVEMRKFILSYGYVFQKIDIIEKKQLIYEQKHIEHDKKFEYVLKQLEIRSDIPKQGIFFNGQIYDAYKFIIKLIKQAEKSLILIDNFVDDSVLTMLDQRKKKVSANIFTRNIDEKLNLSLEKHNEQYSIIKIYETKDFHDRFLIIDNKEIYHIGASLKDMGKKCFAFSKMESEELGLIREKILKKGNYEIHSNYWT